MMNAYLPAMAGIAVSVLGVYLATPQMVRTRGKRSIPVPVPHYRRGTGVVLILAGVAIMIAGQPA